MGVRRRARYKGDELGMLRALHRKRVDPFYSRSRWRLLFSTACLPQWGTSEHAACLPQWGTSEHARGLPASPSSNGQWAAGGSNVVSVRRSSSVRYKAPPPAWLKRSVPPSSPSAADVASVDARFPSAAGPRGGGGGATTAAGGSGSSANNAAVAKATAAAGPEGAPTVTTAAAAAAPQRRNAPYASPVRTLFKCVL